MLNVCVPSHLGRRSGEPMFPGMFVQCWKAPAACSQGPEEAFLADSAFSQCPLKWSPALNSNCFQVLFKQSWHGPLGIPLPALTFNLFLIASQTPEFSGEARGSYKRCFSPSCLRSCKSCSCLDIAFLLPFLVFGGARFVWQWSMGSAVIAFRRAHFIHSAHVSLAQLHSNGRAGKEVSLPFSDLPFCLFVCLFVHFVLCVTVLLVCMSVYQVHAWCPWKSEEGIGSAWIWVLDGREPLCGC